MNIETPEQLNCPICMSILKIPITTQCGHSFCRSCLITSLKTKKVCPMCRTQFQNSAQKLKQDNNLSLILQDYRKQSNHIKITQYNKNNQYQNKTEIMLLLDIKTQQLLLPYNKILVSFQLENPSLLKQEKFVARQQSPFNKFGVISRIVSLNKLRYNVYECILQGKAFCTIQQNMLELGVSQMQQQFSYRTCKAREIVQNCNINPYQFNQFMNKLKQVKDREILQTIYGKIDHKVFQLSNDPIAMFYSIIGVLQIENKQKYQIVTSFNDEKRLNSIKIILDKISHDVSYNVKGFLNVSRHNNTMINSILILLMIILLGFYLNTEVNIQQQI